MFTNKFLRIYFEEKSLHTVTFKDSKNSYNMEKNRITFIKSIIVIIKTSLAVIFHTYISYFINSWGEKNASKKSLEFVFFFQKMAQNLSHSLYTIECAKFFQNQLCFFAFKK